MTDPTPARPRDRDGFTDTLANQKTKVVTHCDHDADDDLAAYDRLPVLLRLALRDADFEYCAKCVARDLRRGWSLASVINSIAGTDAQERAANPFSPSDPVI